VGEKYSPRLRQVGSDPALHLVGRRDEQAEQAPRARAAPDGTVPLEQGGAPAVALSTTTTTTTTTTSSSSSSSSSSPAATAAVALVDQQSGRFHAGEVKVGQEVERGDALDLEAPRREAVLREPLRGQHEWEVCHFPRSKTRAHEAVVDPVPIRVEEGKVAIGFFVDTIK
jgi:hypothetical protein